MSLASDPPMARSPDDPISRFLRLLPMSSWAAVLFEARPVAVIVAPTARLARRRRLDWVGFRILFHADGKAAFDLNPFAVAFCTLHFNHTLFHCDAGNLVFIHFHI